MSEKDSIGVRRTLPESLKGLVQHIARPARGHGGTQPIGEVIEFYGELGLIECRGQLEIGICVFHKRPPVLDQMEMHEHTQELLYAIDDDFIAVAAPGEAGGGAPLLSELVALRVKRGEGLLFQKGVWHWAPFPFAAESFALVGFARGTATTDMIVRDLGRKITIAADRQDAPAGH